MSHCLLAAPWQSRHVLPASTPRATQTNTHAGIPAGSTRKGRKLPSHQMKMIQHVPKSSVTPMLFTIMLMALFVLTRIKSFDINCHSFADSLETAPAHALAPVSHSPPLVWQLAGYCTASIGSARQQSVHAGGADAGSTQPK